MKVLDIITVVILKQQNTSPILTATIVVVMELDWKSYVRLNVVYATVSMIVRKLADIVTCSNSYYILFNLQCQRQHLFQPQVSIAVKFLPPTKGHKISCI